MHKYGDLYKFWINLLDNVNLDDVKLKQAEFLKDLMNRFEVYKTVKKRKKELLCKAEDLYLLLLGNKSKTVNKKIIKSDSDQSDTVKQE